MTDGKDDKKITAMTECCNFVGSSLLQLHQVAKQLEFRTPDAAIQVKDHESQADDDKKMIGFAFSLPVPSANIAALGRGEIEWRIKPFRGTNMKKRLKNGRKARATLYSFSFLFFICS